MKRNELIDLLKGVAIFLVVLGHATQWFSDYDASNRLFVGIYAFHMPLFMFLSGFVSYNPKGEINLSRRFQSLVIPFFSWFIISQLVYKKTYDFTNFIENTKLLFFDPTTGRWFLWILFILCIILYISLKISKLYTEWILVAMLFIISELTLLFVKQRVFYGIPEINWYLIFFIIGFFCNKHQKTLFPYIKVVGIMSILVFPILIFLTKISGKPSFLENTQLADNLKDRIYKVHIYLSAFTGIFAFYFIFNKIKKYENLLKKWLIFLGGISLEIYVTHYHFHFLVKLQNKYLGNYLYINILVFTILAILGSYFLQKFLKKIPFMGRVLYGKP